MPHSTAAVAPATPLLGVTERPAQLRAVLALRAVLLLCGLALALYGEWAGAVRLPWSSLAVVFGLWLLLAGMVLLRLKSATPLGPLEVAVQLFADMAALSLLIYYTGGATNPFVMFYLPLLGLAAAVLPLRQVVVLALLAVLCYTVLTLEYIPLVLTQPDQAVQLHLVGMWLNFLLGVVVLVAFVARLGNALRNQSLALRQAQHDAAHKANLAQLGHYSASLAHELGSPLASVQLLVNDWLDLPAQRSQLDQCPGLLDDLLTLQAQTNRMQQALNSLRQQVAWRHQHQPQVWVKTPVTLQDWGAQWVHHMRNTWPSVQWQVHIDPPDLPCLQLPLALLELGLDMLVDNAVKAMQANKTTDGRLVVRLQWLQGALMTTVTDNGPGFDELALSRVGREVLPSQLNGQGMGLLLLAELLHAQGGRLECNNLTSPATGACACMVLPAALAGQEPTP